MRMRRKPWARPELAACPFYVDDPQQNRGKWKTAFPADQPMVLDLGCGKGVYLARLARRDRSYNHIGVDLKSEVLALAKRQAEEIYGDEPITNLLLMSQDIERLAMIFAPGIDLFSRIHICFCNPWPKQRHHKHRLTYTRQLLTYRELLAPGGELWFKTDDDPLFEDTLGYLAEAGYKVTYITRDLHSSDFAGNITTEHEEMFAGQGIPIKFLIAQPD